MKWLNFLFVWVAVHCSNSDEVCDLLSKLSKEGIVQSKIIKLPFSQDGFTVFYDEAEYIGRAKEFDLKEQR